jgi:hypothetical protein
MEHRPHASLNLIAEMLRQDLPDLSGAVAGAAALVVVATARWLPDRRACQSGSTESRPALAIAGFDESTQMVGAVTSVFINASESAFYHEDQFIGESVPRARCR